MISLIVKTVGLETQRSVSANLNSEFRATGLANLIVAPLGGLAASVLIGPTRGLTEAGGSTRWSGMIAAVLVGLVVAFKVNVAAVVPVPILGGLILYLGVTVIQDSLKRVWAQRDWGTLAFALTVAVVCIRFGYIAGVLLGFVGACLLFAASYHRVGLIRREASRAVIASDVDHGADGMAILRERGDEIVIYWLSGYIFFGSSDVIFERLRAAVGTNQLRTIRYAVLDFAGVTGADASATASLIKLKSYADKQGITLVFCALSEAMTTAMTRDRLIGGASRHHVAPTRQEGLEWCEIEVLEVARSQGAFARDSTRADHDIFRSWLIGEFAATTSPEAFARYFKCRIFDHPGVLYEQGSPATEIDFVAFGIITISFQDAQGGTHRLRRMRQRTVVGEMGFFRSGIRSATVLIEQPCVLYTVTRARFEQMERDDPAMAIAFVTFIVRTLADRLEFANGELATLT
jgi:sulfate permease, SulP family